MEKLTSTQQRILDFLRRYIDEHRYAPSIKEIGENANLKSTSSVQYQVKELERKGYISRVSKQARTITITEFSYVQ